MRLAGPLILLYVRAAEGRSILVEILHRIVPIARPVIGLQGGAGGQLLVILLKCVRVVKIGMAENEIIALVRSSRTARVCYPIGVRVAGRLDTGGRMMSEAEITGEAKRILRVHEKIQSRVYPLKRSGGYSMAALQYGGIRAEVIQRGGRIGDGPVAMGHIVER